MAEIVQSKKDKKTAVGATKAKASIFFPLIDQPRFIEKIEVELRSLHEGNIARYKRPLEYSEWQKSLEITKNLFLKIFYTQFAEFLCGVV